MRNNQLNNFAAFAFTATMFFGASAVLASDPNVQVSSESNEESSTSARPESAAQEEITRDMQGRADMDGNGEINVSDLAFLLGQWGNCPLRSSDPCAGDINADNQVDEQDLSLMLTMLGTRIIPVVNFAEVK